MTTYSNNRPVSQYRIDFLWDGNVLLAEQKVELDITTEPEKHPKPSFNKPDAIYIHRPNSFEPLMQLRQPEPQEIPKQDYLPKPTYSVYYYLNDHLGTPQELLNKHGELVWQARTSPYGEILKLGTNKIPNPIRLPGQYEDSESGLYYNRFRYYSPQDGGYINRDPIGLLGGFNLYDYPRNPISWVDPFGLDTFYQLFNDSGQLVYEGITERHVQERLVEHVRDGKEFSQVKYLDNLDDRVAARNMEGSSLYHNKENPLQVNKRRLDDGFYHSYDPKNVKEGRTFYSKEQIDAKMKNAKVRDVDAKGKFKEKVKCKG